MGIAARQSGENHRLLKQLRRPQSLTTGSFTQKYGRYRTRTCDILLVREALYQLS